MKVVSCFLRVDYTHRYVFDKLVKKYNGDIHVKDLTCYNQFLHLLFGQLTGCDSMRDICMCLAAHSKYLYHLGFKNTVNVSSLARDPDSNKLITFITNNFDFNPLEIANIYRHRWDIEVFFKWIKQNITIKSLWGYSENAVKTHLWVAIIAYLLLAKIKADTASTYTITEVATLVRLSALEKTSLRDLLTKPNDFLRSNQNVKEPSIFDIFNF